MRFAESPCPLVRDRPWHNIAETPWYATPSLRVLFDVITDPDVVRLFRVPACKYVFLYITCSMTLPLCPVDSALHRDVLLKWLGRTMHSYGVHRNILHWLHQTGHPRYILKSKFLLFPNVSSVDADPIYSLALHFCTKTIHILSGTAVCVLESIAHIDHQFCTKIIF